MDKFEYKVIEKGYSYSLIDIEDFLNDEGKYGWELIQVMKDSASFSGLNYHYYFKRKIVNEGN